MKIYIKKDILLDLSIDNYAMGTYIALRSMYRTDKDDYYVSDNLLCHELTGNTTYSKNMKQAVHDGINSLAEKGYITIMGKIGKTEGIINLESLFFDMYKEQFAILYDSEIHKIFSLKGNVDKFALLRYYACLIDTINGNDYIHAREFEDGILKNFVGNQAIKTISRHAGIPEKTGIAYNNLLEQLELIYIFRHDKYSLDGDIKTLTNHYGRKCHEKYIKIFAVTYEQKTGQSKKVIEARKDANERRSLTQKYNAFANGTEYSEDEVFNLFQAVLNHNAKYQRIIDGCSDEEAVANAKKELKDITIFEEYYGIGLEEMFNE